jgi:hypothetical protein
MTDPDDELPPALFSQRTALILLIGIIVAVAAGGLTYLISRTMAGALLAGGAALGASIRLFHGLISR